MKNTRSMIILAVCSAVFILPLSTQAAWTVLDRQRLAKNVVIYEEKMKEWGLDSKRYINMALKIAKLAGVDTAKNETLAQLEDYANNKTNPLDVDTYLQEYTSKTLNVALTTKDIAAVFNGDKETNAKILSAIKHNVEQQKKIEETTDNILEMKSDGQLGEMTKANFLDGLGTTQKLQESSTIIQEFSKDMQAQKSKQMEEDLEHIENVKLSRMKIVDPYSKDDKEKALYEEAVENIPDAFGEKGYKTSDLGFMQF